MSHALLEIDGSFGEGGGQILRTSLALSLLTGRPFRLYNIRAGRSKPGLQPQHLTSVRAAATIGHAKLRGASRGSSDLTFEPGEVTAGNYRFDIGTAGATGLVLQTLYLPLALRGGGPSHLTLIGGTHVSTSPCFHFLDTTWRHYLKLVHLRLSMEMIRPGFYPRGGGQVEVNIQTSDRLVGLHARERGPIHLSGFSAVVKVPAHVVKRQARRARVRLEQQGLHAEISEQIWHGDSGTVLAIVVHTTPAPVLCFGLGALHKPAERVADEAIDQVLAYVRAAPAAVDAHSADQLVLPLALAEGTSEFTVAEVTPHLMTNIAVIRRFLDREIVCDGEEGKPGVVRVS
ncbi:MAG TPA: RNA 3'-terminal phosphate cyclase [Gemmataceae bacterium]|nr:RNA 3'-terminal phosphate cyclase [Gemmataceae bacterium]